jgi:hypothetical protein
MMLDPTSFGATALADFPFSLTVVRDLEEYEGPLLIEMKSSKGETFLQHWCDRYGSLDRWLVVRTPPAEVTRYLVGLVGLRDVITACRDPFVYLLDVARGGVVERSFLLSPFALPEEYLPEPDVRHEARLTRPSAADRYFQDMYVDDDWGYYQVSEYPRKYIQAYSVHALFGVSGDPANVGEIGYRLTQGFVFGTLFTNLGASIRPEKQASLEAVSVASPGFIRFKVDPDIAASVRAAVSNYKVARDRVSEGNYLLGRWVNGHEPTMTEELVRKHVADVSSVLGINSEVLLHRTDTLHTAVKTLRSYVTRISFLATKDAEGTAMFVGIERKRDEPT